MKSLIHLFYGFCLLFPVFINICICLASYRWHLQFKHALAQELERLRKTN